MIAASGCSHSILRLGGIFCKDGPTHLGINKAISKAIEGIVPKVWGSGNAKRNYIYVKDAAQAIVKCLEERILGVHYLGGEEKTIKDMVIDICEVFIPGRKPEYFDGEEALDQIIENSNYFNVTSFRSALEGMQ